jgi:hypothetical protein
MEKLVLYYFFILQNVTVTKRRSEPAVTVVCSSDLLCFSFHRFCSTDIAVGFVGLMFKRQQNDSAYGRSVTATEMVFTNRTLASELFVTAAIKNFMKIQQTV